MIPGVVLGSHPPLARHGEEGDGAQQNIQRDRPEDQEDVRIPQAACTGAAETAGLSANQLRDAPEVEGGSSSRLFVLSTFHTSIS